MKYGYRFSDWGLYSIDEIEEVEDFTEDILWENGKVRFSKDDWCWVKTVKDIFISFKIVDGKQVIIHKNVGPYYKKYIFDTREEADKYGRENSACLLR